MVTTDACLLFPAECSCGEFGGGGHSGFIQNLLEEGGGETKNDKNQLRTAHETAFQKCLQDTTERSSVGQILMCYLVRENIFV